MLYGREAELIVGPKGGEGVKITDLRISFSISLLKSANPNQCQIKVYNLNPETRELFNRKEPTKVILRVGYSRSIGLKTIFNGDLGITAHHYEGSNLVSFVRLIEAGRFHKHARGSITILKGHKYSLAARKLMAMGANIDEVFPIADTDPLEKTLQTDFSFSGQAVDGLDLMSKKLGAQWGIHNQMLQVLPDWQPLFREAVLLTPETGLVGIPSKSTDQGFNLSSSSGDFVRQWEASSLLQPDIYVGMPVQIESKIVNSNFTATSVTHIGDTRGSQWHTKLILTEIGNDSDSGNNNS